MNELNFLFEIYSKNLLELINQLYLLMNNKHSISFQFYKFELLALTKYFFG
jgi:hypothetical protein